MPAIAKTVNRPFHPDNFSLPSRISVWFAAEDSRGVQGLPFELGAVEDIEINVSETFVDKKSARGGIYSTVRRLISENTGEITLGLTELVGRNLEIMFRSATITDRNDVAGNSATIYESSRPRLTGTAASEFADPALEGGFGGNLFFRDVTVVEVSSPDGGTVYTAADDYTLVAAVEGTNSSVALTVGLTTYTASDALLLTESNGSITTLTVGTEIEDGLASTAEIAVAIGRAINANSTDYTAVVVGSVCTVNYNFRDGADPADATSTGGLAADLGGSPHVFAGAVESTATTIARKASGGIPDGAEVRIRYNFLREACDYSLQDGIVLQGLLRVQCLSNAGPQGFYEFYRVSLGLNGAITINPEEFSKASLTATILNDGRGRRGRFVLLKKFLDFFVSPAGACA